MENMTPEIKSLVDEIKLTRKELEDNYVSKSAQKQAMEKIAHLERAINKQVQEGEKVRVFSNASDRQVWKSALAKELLRTGKIDKSHAYWVEKAAGLNEEDSTHGAEFVPSLIDPVINKLIAASGVARNYCRVIPNVQGTLNLKKRVGRAAMAFTARADSTLTPTASTYGSVALSPKQISGITTVEEKLIFDSPINVIEESASDLAEDAGVLEDSTLWNGDGSAASAGYTGVCADSAVLNGGTIASSAFNFDALLNLQTLVHASIIKDPNAKFYMHPYTFALLQSKKASTSGLYFFDISSNSWKVAGYDIVFSQSMDSTVATTKTPVVFGNLSKAVAMGLGRGSELRVLTERYADNNEIGVRLTYDVGFATVLPTALSKITIT